MSRRREDDDGGALRPFFGGRCFYCQCKGFKCPQCGRHVVLDDVVGSLHIGKCGLCGYTDDECSVRAPRREEIFGA